MLSLVSATKSSTHDRVLFGRFLDNCYWILIIIIKVRYGSHLGKTKNTENLKPQPERKLFLSTIRVALGEKKNLSDDTLHNLKNLRSKFSAHNLSNIVSSSFDQRVYNRLSSAEEDDELGPLSSTSSGDDDAEEFCEVL